jgi:hypothetical protein
VEQEQQKSKYITLTCTSLRKMVVIGGWSILQDCARGDWSVSSAAVGRLKDAILLRLNLDRADMAAAWIKPELPFLILAIRRMIPFIDGSAIPHSKKVLRKHIDEGATTHDGRSDYKHIEWTRTNAAQCIALCWSMGAAARIIETTEGVDLIESVVDIMHKVSVAKNDNSDDSNTGLPTRFRGQCVGALAVLRISLSVEIKPTTKLVYSVNTTNVRSALVQKCDHCLSLVQDDFPNVHAIMTTHGKNDPSGASKGVARQKIGWCVWLLFHFTLVCFLVLFIFGKNLNNESIQKIRNLPKFGQYSCGFITCLALAYMYGNAVFGWNDSRTSDLGAVTQFVLNNGGVGNNNTGKTTKIS